MKKIITILILASMITSLTACTKKEAEPLQIENSVSETSISSSEVISESSISEDTKGEKIYFLKNHMSYDEDKQDMTEELRNDTEALKMDSEGNIVGNKNPFNGNGPMIKWAHNEYDVFDTSKYTKCKKKFYKTMFHENGDTQTKPDDHIVVEYYIPNHSFEDSVVSLKVDFDDETGLKDGIKIGIIGEIATDIGNKEIPDSFEPDEIYSANYMVSNPMSGESPEVKYTDENVVGGIYKTDKFVRAISPMGENTNLVSYVVDMGGGLVVDFFFYVSEDASKEDLKKYDYIADTMKILKE